MGAKRHTIQWILIILCFSFLSGCGFRPRQAADVPPELHTLTLKTERPYSGLVTQIKSMLRSLNITLVNQTSQAPYTLNITNINFDHSNPPVTTTSLAVTLTYSMSATVQLVSRNGKILIPARTLSATRSISQNPSQVYTPGTATLAKQELRRDITSKLYYLLTSNNTRRALSHVS